MIVGLTYDLRPEPVSGTGHDDPPDAYAEFDAPGTVEAVAGAIRAVGHEVVPLGNFPKVLAALDTLRVDLVFNIAEGVGGRSRESQIPMLLEARGIPCVGADALSLGISLDKVVAKQVFMADGIPTPRFFVVRDAAALTASPLPFPLIVKPRHEGSSKSLSDKSLVRSLGALKAQAEWLIRTYRQPALVEQFIAGTEFTVAVIGNDPPEALPVVQVEIDGRTDLGDLFYTFSRINAPGLTYRCPAKISPAAEAELRRLAVRAYEAIECRDFGRVDFRVDGQGRPYVLEINPLPSLSTEDVFTPIAERLGVSHQAMIQRILNVAIARCHLNLKDPCPTPSR
ncbi:MAG: ATP-grasp domain-containing protein [Candidatus Omnitrophica bacterium]|nr:ATP-grasp domain-containing protein [Candidatus Omnitrophota bacterium]